MELLIPGLLLVALMIWASTKIKSNAAAAFAPEMIETNDFVIKKPNGFLHVINDSSGLAFRAYSNEYGQNELNGDRKATIEVTIHRDSSVEKVSEKIGKRENLSSSEFIFDAENDDPRRIKHYKLVSYDKNVLELCFAILYQYKDEFSSELDETFTNFHTKQPS